MAIPPPGPPVGPPREGEVGRFELTDIEMGRQAVGEPVWYGVRRVVTHMERVDGERYLSEKLVADKSEPYKLHIKVNIEPQHFNLATLKKLNDALNAAGFSGVIDTR